MLNYLHDICAHNRLAIEQGFHVDYCTGAEALQAVMDGFRDTANFILVDDTSTGNTHSNRVGWFDKRTHAIFILAAYDRETPGDYDRAINLCRTIFRQLMSRLIHDRAAMVGGDMLTYLQLSNVYTEEFGRYSFNGATGLMAMLDNERPTSLIYNADEWQQS